MVVGTLETSVGQCERFCCCQTVCDQVFKHSLPSGPFVVHDGIPSPVELQMLFAAAHSETVVTAVPGFGFLDWPRQVQTSQQAGMGRVLVVGREDAGLSWNPLPITTVPVLPHRQHAHGGIIV